MKLEIPQKFWKEYIESDDLERDKHLEPMIKMIEELVESANDMKKRNPKNYKRLRKHMITTCLRGYIDDLIDTFYILEELKKGKRNEIF